MKRFTNILVVHESDANRAALREALSLARQNGGRVTVVRALPEIPGDVLEVATERALNLDEMLYKDAIAKVQEVVQQYAPKGDIDVSCRVLHGIDFIEIIREALRSDHDLVIKGAGPEIDFGDQLFGSLDLHLLRKCPCPVWLLTPERTNRHRPRVMAAVNVTSDDEVHRHLNRVILELASSQAKRVGAKLDVVVAWRLPGESMLRGPLAGMAEDEVDEMLTATRARFDGRLARLVAEKIPSGLDYSVHVLKGETAPTLARFAIDNAITLMVMGTVGRTGLSGLLISNTVETIVGHVPCSILTVKPPGYQSPVTLN